MERKLTDLEKIYEIAGKHFGKSEFKDKAIEALKELNAYDRQLKKEEEFVARFGRNSAYARYADALDMLCPEIKEGLVSGHFDITDTTIYSVKGFSRNNTTVNMFENPKQLGISNINNGRTPDKHLLLLSDIRLLQKGRSGYGRISPWMEDGELVFTTGFGGKIFTCSMSDFATDTQTVTLVNPKFLRSVETYDVVINLPKVPEFRIFGMGYLKVLLHGLMVYKR